MGSIWKSKYVDLEFGYEIWTSGLSHQIRLVESVWKNCSRTPCNAIFWPKFTNFIENVDFGAIGPSGQTGQMGFNQPDYISFCPPPPPPPHHIDLPFLVVLMHVLTLFRNQLDLRLHIRGLFRNLPDLWPRFNDFFRKYIVRTTHIWTLDQKI